MQFQILLIMIEPINEFQFVHPFSAIIAGPSGCGKTTFVRDILQENEQLISNLRGPPKVTYCYGQYQTIFEEPLLNIHSISYIPNLPTDLSETDILIIDDLMAELGNSRDLVKIFTKQSHHQNVSVIFIAQNLYYQGSAMRDINLNAHHIILFENARDASQVDCSGDRCIQEVRQH